MRTHDSPAGAACRQPGAEAPGKACVLYDGSPGGAADGPAAFQRRRSGARTWAGAFELRSGPRSIYLTSSQSRSIPAGLSSGTVSWLPQDVHVRSRATANRRAAHPCPTA